MVGLQGYCHDKLVIARNHLLLPPDSIRRRLAKEESMLCSFVEIRQSVLESNSCKDHRDSTNEIG